MLTQDEAARIAAQRLGAKQVKRDILLDRDGTEPHLCFYSEEEGSTGFLIIDTLTGDSVIYTHSCDWQWDYPEADWNFEAGLRSQRYRLELFEFGDWERARSLLWTLQLPLSSLNPPLTSDETTSDWLTVDLTPLQERYQQQGKLVFSNVDVNGCYRVLIGARYYKAFDSRLFTYDQDTQTATEIIVPDEFEEHFVEDLEGLEDEGGFDYFLLEVEVFAKRELLS